MMATYVELKEFMYYTELLAADKHPTNQIPSN